MSNKGEKYCPHCKKPLELRSVFDEWEAGKKVDEYYCPECKKTEFSINQEIKKKNEELLKQEFENHLDQLKSLDERNRSGSILHLKENFPKIKAFLFDTEWILKIFRKIIEYYHSDSDLEIQGVATCLLGKFIEIWLVVPDDDLHSSYRSSYYKDKEELLKLILSNYNQLKPFEKTQTETILNIAIGYLGHSYIRICYLAVEVIRVLGNSRIINPLFEFLISDLGKRENQLISGHKLYDSRRVTADVGGLIGALIGESELNQVFTRMKENNEKISIIAIEGFFENLSGRMPFKLLNELNNYILQGLGDTTLELDFSDQVVTFDEIVLKCILKIYRRNPELQNQFEPFIMQILKVFNETYISKQKNIATKIITFFGSTNDFQGVLDRIVPIEIKTKLEEIKHQIASSKVEILNTFEKNFETILKKLDTLSDKQEVSNKLIDYLYKLNNIQTAIPVIIDIWSEPKESKKPEKIYIKVLCVKCGHQTSFLIFQKDNKNTWEKFKSRLLSFLKLTALICSFTSVIGGIIGISKFVSEYSINPQDKLVTLAQKIGELEEAVPKISKIIEEIRKPIDKDLLNLKELKETYPEKQLPELEKFKLLNKWRLEILSQITQDHEVEETLQNLIDKAMSDSFKKDISGFYIHKDCSNHILEI